MVDELSYTTHKSSKLCIIAIHLTNRFTRKKKTENDTTIAICWIIKEKSSIQNRKKIHKSIEKVKTKEHTLCLIFLVILQSLASYL